MAKQSLELTILRKGRREDVIEVTATRMTCRCCRIPSARG